MELIDRRLLDEAPHDGPLDADEKRTRLHDLVNDAKMEAEHHRTAGNDTDASWDDLRDFYAGEGQSWKQVAPGLPAELQDDWSTTNHTKASCQSVVDSIVKALPTWFVVEMDTLEEDDASQKVTTYLRAWADIINYEREQKMAVSNALQVGLGVLKVYWDKQRGPKGEVVVQSVRPENIFPDPTALRLEECAFVAIRNLYGIERALKMWPDLDLTKVETTHGEEAEFGDQAVVQESRGATCVVVWEVYYDFGDRLMIYSAEQTLFDGTSPVPKSQVLAHRYPLHFYEFEPREDNFWPTGLVQELMDPQNRLNKSNTRIGIWERYFVSPTWDTTSQAVKDTFDKTPGSINYHEPDSTLTPHWAPPIPGDVFAYLQGAKADLDGISGSVEVTRGLRPTGVNTGVALQVLHEAAQQRQGGRAQDWTYSKRHLGQRAVELMMKHYSDDRQLAIVEDDAGDVVSLTADDMSRQEPTGEFIEEFDEGSGQIERIPEMKTEPRQYFVVTQPGGDIPMSLAARAEMAVQLKQIPSSVVGMTVVDDEAVLEAVQFPGRDKILERRDAVLQAQMEGEQQAMAAQQQQEQAVQIQQQMEGIAIQLQELLPQEMFDLLQGIMAGVIEDEQLIAEFMVGVAEIGPEVYALVQQYLELARALEELSQPADDVQPMM